MKSDKCFVLKNSFNYKKLIYCKCMLLCFFLLISCGKKEADYIWNPKTNPPEVEIEPEGFSDKEVISIDTVKIEWDGNSPISEFSYKLNESSWSSWSGTVLKVEYTLDDGDYEFIVRTRYEGQKTIKADTVFFTVNAVDSPGIAIYPRIKTTKEKSTEISLRPKGLQNCKLFHVEFEDSGLDIEITDTVNTALVSGNVIDLIAGPQQSLFEKNENLTFTIKNGKPDTVFLNFKKVIARDSSNTEIDLKTVRGGMVIFK